MCVWGGNGGASKCVCVGGGMEGLANVCVGGNGGASKCVCVGGGMEGLANVCVGGGWSG